MVRFGPKCPRGFLPVYSVGDEEEAKALLIASCPRNYQGEFVAEELAQEQTLERLQVFSDRLHTNHERLKAAGLCRCKEVPRPMTTQRKSAKQKEATVKERIKAALQDGPKTPMELAINLYGGVEKPYRSPKHADRPPKLICKDAGGEGRVRHDLWEMLRDKELVRIKRGLYALPT